MRGTLGTSLSRTSRISQRMPEQVRRISEAAMDSCSAPTKPRKV
jgi:hypothetical protein